MPTHGTRMISGRQQRKQQPIEPYPVNSASGCSNLVLDGRMLDCGNAEVKAALGEDASACTSLVKHMSFKHKQRPRHGEDKPPLTPPKVAGVSLAPIPDVECTELMAKKKAPPNKTASTNMHLSAAKPCGLQDLIGGSPTKADDTTTLFAQGHSLNPRFKDELHQTCCAEELDPRITYFREINDGDSLCGTPCCLDTHALLRLSTESKGPLGPFTPQPLSPSIINAGPLWETIDGLPDMRGCNTVPTPRLPDSKGSCISTPAAEQGTDTLIC